MASILDRVHERLQPLVVVLDVGRKAALVSHGGCVLAVPALHDALERVVHLGPHLQSLLERPCSRRCDHELLHRQLVSGMLTSVDDVHHRNWHFVLLLPRPGRVNRHRIKCGVLELTNILIEFKPQCRCASSRDAHGHGKHSVGTEICLRESPLVFGPVQLVDHELVQLLLVPHILTLQLRGNLLVDVFNRLGHTFALVPRSTIAQLQCLIDASRGPAWHYCPDCSITCGQLSFDSGVATTVDHLTPDYADDLCVFILGEAVLGALLPGERKR
mmetsp:Transcript_89452/g.253429  ORF Transcript_89452/g.253429 Transcript_89452/m.253429 type:complete len:273 (-) Transcript_89452:472-1290(-)